jgi:acyl carrier protein
MTPRQIIRNYILENFLFVDDPSAIADDDSFLEKGIIDSVGALEITVFLEKCFQFTVKEEEMLPVNLDSVNNLVAFIEKKQKGVGRDLPISTTTAALVAG